MALGIDIYRYQTVTDWKAVKGHGVSFVYVKGTDGGGPAYAPADAQVRGAQSVGIPVGLYHYAQLSPTPEAQADILTGEVRRLGAYGLPPALDLEDPHQPGPVARDFALRFLTRLTLNGFDAVTLYANTSMLSGIEAYKADKFGPWISIWAAAYGPNDGARHPLTYRGPVDVHQFTSEGVVPGINGRVDLNESLTPFPPGGTDVALKDEKIKFDNGYETNAAEALANLLSLVSGLAGYKLSDKFEPIEQRYPAWLKQLRNTDIPQLKTGQSEILTAYQTGYAALLSAVQAGGLDPEAFAQALAPALAPLVQAGVSEAQVRAACDEVIKAAFNRGGASVE